MCGSWAILMNRRDGSANTGLDELLSPTERIARNSSADFENACHHVPRMHLDSRMCRRHAWSSRTRKTQRTSPLTATAVCERSSKTDTKSALARTEPSPRFPCRATRSGFHRRTALKSPIQTHNPRAGEVDGAAAEEKVVSGVRPRRSPSVRVPPPSHHLLSLVRHRDREKKALHSNISVLTCVLHNTFQSRTESWRSRSRISAMELTMAECGS